MAQPQVSRARPYRDFLTPVLHRQFVQAAVFSLVACYIPAVWLSTSGFPWRYLPLGTAFRAIVLFLVCNATVLLARLAGQHVGLVTTVSPFQYFQRSLLNPSTCFTTIAYLVSAILFAEITVLSYHSESHLKLVSPGSHNERAHLNEQGIFFRSLFPVLALLQVAFHLFLDLDCLKLPYDKASAKEAKSLVRLFVSDSGSAALILALASIVKATIAIIIGTITYFMIYRQWLWHWCFGILKNFYFFPRNASFRRHGSAGLLPVWPNFLITGFLLSLIWDLSNLAFTLYMTEEPLKKGQPLTSGSKDPNGSLISGLRAKHELTKTRAFWELVLISNRFGDRRRTIYLETDRAGGSTWSQMSTICLQELAAISVRISEFNTSLHPPAPAPLPSVQKVDSGLTRGAKSDPSIFTTEPTGFKSRAKDLVTDFATAHIFEPGSSNPPKLLAEKAYGLLSDEQRAHIKPEVIQRQASGIMASILKTPLAYPIRQAFSRRTAAVICGSPYSENSILIDAVDILSKLAVHSIAEDKPGQVQKDVYNICRTFAAIIIHIQGFLASAPPHWTDVDFSVNHRKPSPEIEALLKALRGGLEVIVRAFGEYLDALHVPKDETRQWTQLLAEPKPAPALRASPAERNKRQSARPKTPPMQLVSR